MSINVGLALRVTLAMGNAYAVEDRQAAKKPPRS
jgi:hypothetical protein